MWRMSAVNYKVGNEKLIKVLTGAASHLSALLEKQGRSDGALRIAVVGGAFELLDKNGNLVTDKDIITEPTLIYFGFTFCPDFCPIDMARNSAAVDLLAEQGISATPMFISIDPERDTPEIVGDYAFNFHDKAIGLTGSAEQVDAASKAYRTFYQKDASGDPDYYLMQHTTFTYLTLPELGFVEFFRNTNTAEEVAETVSCYVNAS
jgi:protein SCO1/2